jgi:hypothetical protein
MCTTVLLLLVSICHYGHHLSLVMNRVKVTKEEHVWVLPAMCSTMVTLVYFNHTLCPIYTNMPLLQCAPLLFCCMFIFVTGPSFVIGDEWNQGDWRSTYMGTSSVPNGNTGLYWSYSMSCIHKQAIAAMCTIVFLSYLSHRPSFVAGYDWSQSEGRKTCMGTSSVSNGNTGLYWS